MRQDWQKGFTLLELLIAISIFAVLSVMAYGGLRTVITTSQHTQEVSQQFASVQKLFLLLSQDLFNASERPVRDEFGDELAAFDASLAERSDLFSLTRSQMADPLAAQQSLQRINYRFEDGKLLRLTWPVLDRVQNTEPGRIQLLDGVKSAELAFLGDEWSDHWPPTSTGATPTALPRALSINLDIDGIGQIQRILAITL
ncbi:MAG: type II secretion system minor pseudopilin GspJ [Chromatiales bacterium]|jgi:general secretion pathway protein J